jgi:hypothetical protein
MVELILRSKVVVSKWAIVKMKWCVVGAVEVLLRWYLHVTVVRVWRECGE